MINSVSDESALPFVGTKSLPLTFDFNRIHLTASGISEFYWPLDQTEIISVRDICVSGLTTLIREYNSDEAGEGAVLTILYLFIVVEAMATYRAHALCRRTKTSGREIEAKADSRLMGPIAAGASPGPPILVQNLIAGPVQPNLWLRPARVVKNYFRRDGIIRQEFLRKNISDDIITTTITPLIVRHAHNIADEISYFSPHHWFPPLADKRFHKSNGLSNAAIDQIISIIDASFRTGNEILPNQIAKHFHTFLHQASILVSARLSRLIANPKHLPKCFWDGTGTKIWSRMLRYATRINGGKVIGHDHGQGIGFITDGSDTLTDLECCDEFFTYTTKQATGAREAMRSEFLICSNKPPKITALEPFSVDTALDPKPKRNTQSPDPVKDRGNTINTVMFVVSMYAGEKVHGMPLMPDHASVDWECRLISHLREWGYEVYLKPHPDAPFSPPKDFVNKFGAQLLNGRFEDVIKDIDAVIFDMPFTTTFASALKSDKSVILVEFGKSSVAPICKKLLNRRCASLLGWYDNDNRPRIDWLELRQAIEKSAHLRDNKIASILWEQE